MCLTLHPTDSHRPYNKSNIRYKIATIEPNGRLFSAFRYTPYRKRCFNKARNVYCTYEPCIIDPTTTGFHIYTNKRFATQAASYYNYSSRDNHVVLKVQVKGFLRKGIFMGKRCETWRYMKILSVTRVSNLYKNIYKL